MDEISVREEENNLIYFEGEAHHNYIRSTITCADKKFLKSGQTQF
jgi:hypothetical protein